VSRRGGAAVWTRLLSPQKGSCRLGTSTRSRPAHSPAGEATAVKPVRGVGEAGSLATCASDPVLEASRLRELLAAVCEDEAEALGWRYWSDGLDLHLILCLCVTNSFIPTRPYSGSANVTARRRQYFNASAETLQRPNAAGTPAPIIDSPVTRASPAQAPARVVAREANVRRLPTETHSEPFSRYRKVLPSGSRKESGREFHAACLRIGHSGRGDEASTS